eukprot:6198593-Pleurochrysis_carterae.AAC.1
MGAREHGSGAHAHAAFRARADLRSLSILPFQQSARRPARSHRDQTEIGCRLQQLARRLDGDGD